MRDDRKIKDIYNCEYIEFDGKMYPLQKWYNQLLDKKIFELEVSDVSRMIRQNVFIEIAIVRAIDYLRENPFVGDMYEGEMLEKLSKIDIDIMMDYIDEIKKILVRAKSENADYNWVDIQEEKEFAVIVSNFIENVEKVSNSRIST